jgi:hypothetical protein
LSYYDSEIIQISYIEAYENTYDRINYLDDSGFQYGIFADRNRGKQISTANIFKAQSDSSHRGQNTRISKVQYVNADVKMNVEIKIYTDVDRTQGPTSGKLQEIGTNGETSLIYTNADSGIRSVDLPHPVDVTDGSDYAIVVKFTANNDEDDLVYYAAETSKSPMYYPADNKFSFNAGESFISEDGENFTDFSDFYPVYDPSIYGKKGNFNIRAYTNYLPLSTTPPSVEQKTADEKHNVTQEVSSPTPQRAEVSKLTTSKTFSLEVGKTKKLPFGLTYSAGEKSSFNLKVTSTNTKVVKVVNGNIKALKVGQTTVTLTIPALSSSTKKAISQKVKVTVLPKAVSFKVKKNGNKLLKLSWSKFTGQLAVSNFVVQYRIKGAKWTARKIGAKSTSFTFLKTNTKKQVEVRVQSLKKAVDGVWSAIFHSSWTKITVK